MDYKRLEHCINYYKNYPGIDMDMDDLFIAGHILNMMIEYTGEDLDTIMDTHPRDSIWTHLEMSYKKVINYIKNYDEYYCSEFCDDDEEKEKKYPYDYNILLEAIKETKKKNPKIYVTRWGIYRTEIIEQYWKLYGNSKKPKKKPSPKPKKKKDTTTIKI